MYCYFVSNFGDTPAFPYLIGNTWKNLPITQNVKLIDGDSIIVPTNQTSQYSTGTTVYDLELIDRFRNGKVVSQNSTIQLALASLTEGDISSVRIEEGLANSKAVTSCTSTTTAPVVMVPRRLLSSLRVSLSPTPMVRTSSPS